MPADKESNKNSPSSEAGEDTETEYSSDADEEQQSSLFGNMRTRLCWEAASNTMHLDVRQYLQNRHKLDFRFKGRLDTSSGQYTHVIQLQRLMSQNTPSLARIIAAERGIPLEDDDQHSIDTDRFLPAGLKTLLFKDWTMAPGVRFLRQGHNTPASAITAAPAAASDVAAAGPGSSSSGGGGGGMRYCVTFRKQPQVLWRRGVWDSWLEGKADFEIDAAQQQVGLRGAVRLKVLRLNVTDKQDLQLSTGLDYIGSSSHSSGKGSAIGGSWTPYLRIGENSWAVRLSKSALAFTYEM